jgi:hypothetical protein
METTTASDDGEARNIVARMFASGSNHHVKLWLGSGIGRKEDGFLRLPSLRCREDDRKGVRPQQR